MRSAAMKNNISPGVDPDFECVIDLINKIDQSHGYRKPGLFQCYISQYDYDDLWDDAINMDGYAIDELVSIERVAEAGYYRVV